MIKKSLLPICTGVILSTALLLVGPFSWAKVSGADYEELTYDDLVNQLSEKRVDATRAHHVPEIKTHLGFGMTNSFNQLSSSGHSYTAQLSGYEFSYGADLNSENIRGEMVVRILPETESGTETASLREFDGTVAFRRELKKNWHSKFAGGLAIRFLGFSDSAHKVDLHETSSMFLGATGIEATLSPHVAISGDLSLRSPFGSSTPEKQSLSFGVKLDTTFE